MEAPPPSLRAKYLHRRHGNVSIGYHDARNIVITTITMTWCFCDFVIFVMFFSCGANGQCYVTNDGIDPFKGTLTITAVNFVDGTQSPAMPAKTLDMEAGIAVTEFFTLDNFSSIDANSTLLLAEIVSAQDGATVSKNVIALTPPANWHIPAATVTVTSISPNGSQGASIVLKADKTALYVTMTTLATGRFGENAFVMLPGEEKTVSFLPFSDQVVRVVCCHQ